MNACNRGTLGNRMSDSFQGIVTAYINNYRDSAARELRFYVVQKTLADAIQRAASCTLPGGNRHGHQRRLPCACLTEANMKLQKKMPAISRASDFHALYELVEQELNPIKGIGDLTIYDISQRIGAFLKMEPSFVYLHAGTREGARFLGVEYRTRQIELKQLPDSFYKLRPYEAEDCLCIYKYEIKKIVQQSASWDRRETAHASP